MSRPLGSAPTPASRNFTATTGRSAGERRIGTPCLRSAASARSLLPAGGPHGPVERPGVSTLAFSRSVQEPQTRFTPSPRRTPPGPYTGTCQAHPGSETRTPGFDVTQLLTTLQQRTPTGITARSFWHVSLVPTCPDQAEPFPYRSPRRSSANAAQGGLTPAPVRPTSKGQQSFISRTAPPSAWLPTSPHLQRS